MDKEIGYKQFVNREKTGRKRKEKKKERKYRMYRKKEGKYNYKNKGNE